MLTLSLFDLDPTPLDLWLWETQHTLFQIVQCWPYGSVYYSLSEDEDAHSDYRRLQGLKKPLCCVLEDELF